MKDSVKQKKTTIWKDEGFGLDVRNYQVIGLRKIGSLLWRNIMLIVAAAVACAAVGFCAAQYGIAPTYSASADLLVNNSQDRPSGTTITSSDISASSNLVGTYSIILKSHTILEQVISDLHLDCTYQQLAKQISVSSVNSTQVMRVTVKNGSAATAMQIVGKMVELAPDVIMDTVEAGSVKTVDAPWTTGLPVAPNKKIFTAAAGLLGMLVSVCVLLLREMLNNTFKSDEDIRKILDLPVIGVIPLEDEEMQHKGRATQKGRH